MQKKPAIPTHAKSITQVLTEVHTSLSGLTDQEAVKRLAKYGKNTLPQSDFHGSKLSILLSQFKSTLMIVLIAAGAISGFLREYSDMIVIFLTAVLNAIIGFIQEYKANEALNALRSLVQYKALVIRNGSQVFIESDDVVVGDILCLEAGDKIQADGRIIEAVEFSTNESALTGESESILKVAHEVKNVSASVGDQRNMVFKGTIANTGRAKVVVTATGTQTEIGKIATLVKDTEDEATPLQKQLEKLSKQIASLVLVICVLLLVVGFIKGARTFPEMIVLFETAVAVAVAAIPEGLVISLTVILAIGMQFILKRNALVRRLVAAETLGSISVICTDKTGTITHGVMNVVRAITEKVDMQRNYLLSYDRKDNPNEIDVESLLFLAHDASNIMVLNPQDEQDQWKFSGDSLDVAIAEMLVHMRLYSPETAPPYNRIHEIPFTSTRKYMAAVKNVDVGYTLAVKGAAEIILEHATHIHANGIRKLSERKKEELMNLHDRMTESGLRVIAVAYKTYEEPPQKISDEDVENLVFKGFLAFEDPLRDDVEQTLRMASRAGIRTIMITGDHVKTAQSIARQIGLPYDDNAVFDGKKLSSINDKELQEAVKDVRIFARVDPIHKIRIVRALQANGEVVAMTGDGVNDAPALKGADIGIALGSGTTVAKETADIVLLDDAFSTILGAIEQGRNIYQNIKKVILYLLSGSLSEVVIIAASIVAGLPLAALPAQILWINLVIDTFPNMALAFEKGEKENLNDMPRKKDASILDGHVKAIIVVKTIVENILLFVIFDYFFRTTGDIALARTLVFVGFGIGALFYIFSIRTLRFMIWSVNPFENPYLIFAVILGWALLIAGVHWHPLQVLLHTVPLNSMHWFIMVIFGMVNLLIFEVIKALFILNKKTTQASTRGIAEI